MAEEGAKQTGEVSVKAATQISVTLDNIPGELAKIAAALAEAGVNIEGIGRTVSESKVKENLVVDNVAAAIKAIEAMGKKVSTDEVLHFYYSNDRPGVIAAIARKLGDDGINIENMYYASTGRGKAAVVYVAVAKESFEKALKLAQEV